MVTLSRDLEPADETALRRLVENHAAYTGSERAATLLADWETAREQFVRVMPDAYAEVIAERARADVRTALPPAADALAAATPGAGRAASTDD
jgi:glutamate synthase (NADPH/NADH) large chain